MPRIAPKKMMRKMKPETTMDMVMTKPERQKAMEQMVKNLKKKK